MSAETRNLDVLAVRDRLDAALACMKPTKPMTSATNKAPKARPLKLWNGRSFGRHAARSEHKGHIYVAAYNVADARRLCEEVGLGDPKNTEITVYWSADCWGVSMNGIEPERGVWITMYRTDVPVRIRNKSDLPWE